MVSKTEKEEVMRTIKDLNKSFLILFLLIFTFGYFSIASAQSSAARDLNRKGVQAIDSGHHQDAVQYLKEAMSLEPKWGEPVYNAGRLMRLRTQNETAYNLFKKAYMLEPKNSKYLEEYTKGLVEKLNQAKAQNNRTEIYSYSEEIIKINPSKLDIGLELLNRHKKDGNQRKALDLAKKLIDENPRMRIKYQSEEMGRIYLYLAEYYFDKNELAEAKLNSDNSLKFTLPPSANARELSAKIRAAQTKKVDGLIANAEAAIKRQDIGAALDYLGDAEKIQPHNARVQALLEEVHTENELAAIIAKAKKHANKDEWLEVRDLLGVVVNEESITPDIKTLYKKAVEEENTVLNAIGQATQLPRDKLSREHIVKEFLERGNAYFKAQNYKDAELNYTKGLTLAKFDKLSHKISKLNNALQEIQEIEHRKETWEKAIETRTIGDYEEVIKLLVTLDRDYNIQLTSYLAEAYWKTGEFKKALDNAQYQLAIQPENNRAKFVAASIYLDQGEKDLAYRYFREIHKDDPDYPELSDKLILASSSKIKHILPFVIIIILLWLSYALYKYLPEYNKNTSIKKANKYLRRDMLKEAIDELMLVRRLPILTAYDAAVISRILAQTYLKKGDYDKAIGESKHLLSLNRNDGEARIWLASAYLGGRILTPESLPELLNLYEKEPRNLALVSLLGRHYTQHKSLPKEGVEILEQWLALEPNNPDVLRPLGRYYLRLTRTDDKAMKVFQKMMEIMTTHNAIEPEFLLGVARIHMKMRQFDDCLQLCEQVINADVNNELVHAILLDVYTQKNELHNLLEIYSNFLKENPYNVAFQNGLVAAREKISSLEKAQQSREAQMVRDREMQQRREQREALVRQRQEEQLRAQQEAEQQEILQEEPQEPEVTGEEVVAENVNVEPVVDAEEGAEVEQEVGDLGAEGANVEPVESVEEVPQNTYVPLRPKVDDDITCPNCQEKNKANAYVCEQCGGNLF